jgi:hypothetical protein
MYVHALLVLSAMIKLPCLVSEDHGSNQGCLERTTFSIPGRRGTGRERACSNSVNTRYGSLRCAAIGSDGDVKPEEVQLFGSLNWSMVQLWRYDCTVRNCDSDK